MLLNDWMSTFTELLNRKQASRALLSNLGKVSPRNRRQSRRSAGQCPSAPQWSLSKNGSS